MRLIEKWLLLWLNHVAVSATTTTAITTTEVIVINSHLFMCHWLERTLFAVRPQQIDGLQPLLLSHNSCCEGWWRLLVSKLVLCWLVWVNPQIGVLPDVDVNGVIWICAHRCVLLLDYHGRESFDTAWVAAGADRIKPVVLVKVWWVIRVQSTSMWHHGVKPFAIITRAHRTICVDSTPLNLLLCLNVWVALKLWDLLELCVTAHNLICTAISHH